MPLPPPDLVDLMPGLRLPLSLLRASRSQQHPQLLELLLKLLQPELLHPKLLQVTSFGFAFNRRFA